MEAGLGSESCAGCLIIGHLGERKNIWMRGSIACARLRYLAVLITDSEDGYKILRRSWALTLRRE